MSTSLKIQQPKFIDELEQVDDLYEEYRVDGFLMNWEKLRAISYARQDIKDAIKEHKKASYFIEHKNMALDRDKILSAVWDDYYGDERTVDTHVKMLRKSLGKYRDLIKTVRGMGYKLEI